MPRRRSGPVAGRWTSESTHTRGSALHPCGGVPLCTLHRAARSIRRACRARRIQILLAAMLLSQVALDASAQATLWISDNVTNTIYQVTLDGTLLSSFPALMGAHSSVEVDRFTDTLWGAAESSGGGRLVNFNKVGQPLPACGVCAPTIGASVFGATQPEGVSVDFVDATLWVVDDPEIPAVESKVYNVARDGTLISSFPTSSFAQAAQSPQDVAVDPFDGTLWVTDNISDTIYNVTKTGALVASFPALVYTSVLDPGITDVNPQGISVDSSNGTLWVTDRGTGRVYNVASGRGAATAGDLISSFESTAYDAASMNPTGVAYDDPAASVPSLERLGLLLLAIAMIAVAGRVLAPIRLPG